MSAAEPARSGIGGEIIMTVRRKDRGVDVRITVVPEADAVTPDGVVVDIVNGEWPEQRPDPSISAVAVSPPPVRDAAAVPARQRRGRQQGGQNDNGNSNAGLRQGTLPHQAHRVTLDDAERKRKFRDAINLTFVRQWDDNSGSGGARARRIIGSRATGCPPPSASAPASPP